MADGIPSLSLRAATTQDLMAMAKVHRAAYSAGHFLALLPEPVLAEYYRLFLGGGSHAVIAALQAEAGGPATLQGFAVFGENIEARIGQFKREQRLAILKTAAAHPVISARKAAFSLFGNGSSNTPHDPAPWLLLSIAVSGARKGIGSALLHEMIRAASADGQQRFGLYVRHSNFGAVNAYLRAGFRIVATIADQYYMEIALNTDHTPDTR